jgi:predicted deacylase
MRTLAAGPSALAGWQEWIVDEHQAVSVFRCRGAQAGPLVAITAGIHGDEFEGPAAVFDLASELAPDKLRGTLLLIPIANPAAFRNGTRTSPLDGRDLARTFPGDPTGPATASLASTLFETLSEVDFLVDLHSGGTDYNFAPVAGFYGLPDETNSSFRTASQFGFELLWQLPETPGVLSYELHRRGATVCGCEYGGAAQLASEGRTAYRAGILACLAAWGVYGEQSQSAIQPAPFSGDWMHAETDGLFVGCVQPGAAVQRGQILATIIDARGNVVQQVEADSAGIVLGIRSKASIVRGSMTVLLGHSMKGAHVRRVA